MSLTPSEGPWVSPAPGSPGPPRPLRCPCPRHWDVGRQTKPRGRASRGVRRGQAGGRVDTRGGARGARAHGRDSQVHEGARQDARRPPGWLCPGQGLGGPAATWLASNVKGKYVKLAKIHLSQTSLRRACRARSALAALAGNGRLRGLHPLGPGADPCVCPQVALVFPNNDPAASMVAFYGCLLAEVVPVPIEVPLTRKVRSDAVLRSGARAREASAAACDPTGSGCCRFWGSVGVGRMGRGTGC